MPDNNSQNRPFYCRLAIATVETDEMTIGTEEMTDGMTAEIEEMIDATSAEMITVHGDSYQKMKKASILYRIDALLISSTM